MSEEEAERNPIYNSQQPTVQNHVGFWFSEEAIEK